MIHWLAILLALSAFALIALSMPRHQADMAGRKLAPTPSHCARVGGYAQLLAALLLDGIAFGGAYGAIAWFSHLSIGAWSVVIWLCVRARRAALAGGNRRSPPESN